MGGPATGVHPVRVWQSWPLAYVLPMFPGNQYDTSDADLLDQPSLGYTQIKTEPPTGLF